MQTNSWIVKFSQEKNKNKILMVLTAAVLSSVVMFVMFKSLSLKLITESIYLRVHSLPSSSTEKVISLSCKGLGTRVSILPRGVTWHSIFQASSFLIFLLMVNSPDFFFQKTLKYFLLRVRLFCMALVEQLGDDSW